ncbi:MAG: LysR family transcriptional regulator [Polyangiaceae bacterium]|nr:LysR family transcriptional regulator [Polyangiaceae bacterium]
MTDVEALDQRLLRAFVVVAEELHFGRAARRLHISQPPLSMQIKKLEELVGAPLFERDRRHVELTDAGAYLLPTARRWLKEAEQTVQRLQAVAAGQAGVLRVGYTPTATYELLPVWLRELKKQLPGLSLELVELGSPAQVAALQSERIELGLACGPVLAGATTDAAQLSESVLHHDRLVVALPSRHPLAARRSVPVRALDGQLAVFVKPEVEPAWANAASVALGRAGVVLDVVQETDTKLALLGLIASGMGLSVVSRSMTRVGRKGVVFRELSGLKLRLSLTALSRAETSMRVQHALGLAQRLARAFEC